MRDRLANGRRLVAGDRAEEPHGLQLAAPRAGCTAAVRLFVAQVGRPHGSVGEPATPGRRSRGRARPCWDSALAASTATLRAAATPAASSPDHRGGLAGRRRGAGGAVAGGLRRWAARPGGGGHGGRRRGGRVAGRVGGTRFGCGDGGAGGAGLLDGDERVAVGAAAGPVGPSALPAAAGGAAGLALAGGDDLHLAGPAGAATAAVRGGVPHRLDRLGAALRTDGGAGGRPGRDLVRP